ncbi:MgtC/SapB family protein [archaeon]|nr:MgtC/SapB family protein [archaeon]
MDFLNFGIAIFLGALIGMQREFAPQKENFTRFAGIRTFILITLFGAILGFLGGDFNSLPVIIGFAGIILFSALSYILTFVKFKVMSIITEVVSIMAFILGVMCTTGFMNLAIIFGILIVAFLAFKERLHGLIKKMNRKEVSGVIKFAIISLVVLPLLPDKNFSPADLPGLNEILNNFGVSNEFLSQLNVFNFYHIWWMVILVAGISFFGYFLVRFLGSKKGHGLTGFVGGLVSSTAVTLSMSKESQGKTKVSPYILATIIAMSIMFIRIIFEVAVLNPILLGKLFLPLMGMFVLGLVFSFYFLRTEDKNPHAKEIEFKQPFAMGPAIKFGLLFLLVLLVSKIGQILFGHLGIYGASILSGLVDVDAITLSMSSLSKTGEITSVVASTSILFAAISNTLVKMGIAFFLGSKKYGKTIVGVFSIVLLVGLGLLFFL